MLTVFAGLAARHAEAAKPTVDVPTAAASSEAEMKPYTDIVSNTSVKFEMLPIRGGKFTMGSPPNEPMRSDDEGPQHEVEISPFWMGKYEVTWDEYEIFMFQLDIAQRKLTNTEPTPLELAADALIRPTKPYTDMTFGMGKETYPAICMTQYAAFRYCEWLSAKTGRYYRLPTEAEWEYACRAGTTTSYAFGDDVSKLGDYAWFYENSEEAYHPIAKKKPNPWGLYDMHGNVSEWCADAYQSDFYATMKGKVTKDPLNVPKEVEPCVVRGGSWDDDPDRLRSAARRASSKEWKQQDPQIPQSVWYYTDALFNGFRIVRPLVEPPEKDKKNYGFADLSR
ncbi:MAG TPA: SUMF1/EgtB/PvdO family nonheme iron enzyme [Pirellulales bacterium]|nr:SUMF1/EgtB/PvdO family nonheme iron enzyme [Pirellulales bacterium]